MPINILMPALSPTMEKGNLAKWLKKEGDKVKPGDVIAEIETDKATMEYEAVDEGTLAKIVVPEGTADVPVNQLIAVLAVEGEDVKAAAAAARRPRRSQPQPPTPPRSARSQRKRQLRPPASRASRSFAAARRRREASGARTDGQGAEPRLRLTAGAPVGARSGHRHRASRHGTAWPRHRPRCRRAAKAGGPACAGSSCRGAAPRRSIRRR